MEQWKKIKGYENYSVSNLGRVRNDLTGRILKPCKDTNGYFQVVLYKNGERKHSSVHRLVAIAFISNPENKPDINHKNLIKTDNRVENLERCTHKENNDHADKNGIKTYFQKNHKLTRGSKCGTAKLNENQVLEIRKLYATDNYFQRELGERFDITQEQIGHIVNYKSWKHLNKEVFRAKSPKR